MCSQQDSNLRCHLRRVASYPLDHGSVLREKVRERGIEPLRRSYGVTARWAHHLPNSRWGDRRELNPLRPRPQLGSSPIGSVTMVLRDVCSAKESNLHPLVVGQVLSH